MIVPLSKKNIRELYPTDILFQTEYWAKVKNCLGWKPYAFNIGRDFARDDMLILVKSIGGNVSAAYVPQGPEFEPDIEHHGRYLEALSESIADQLDSKVAFIRYDLPWRSPYADDILEHPHREVPDDRVRELRMNFGTRRWNLKKAPVDMTFADTYRIGIGCAEEEILARMKSKTRYNISLARRKGVRVRAVSADQLPVFYDMYLETARRNGIFISDYRYFSTLFSARVHHGDSPEIVLLMATHDNDILACGIITITAQDAFFLHGASSNAKRNLMGSHALHWEAIRYAKSRGCRTYDMGAVSPGRIPDHSFFGLYRFKTGFGGRIVHRTGSWDYPIKESAYTAFRNWEKLRNDQEDGERGIA